MQQSLDNLITWLSNMPLDTMLKVCAFGIGLCLLLGYYLDNKAAAPGPGPGPDLGPMSGDGTPVVLPPDDRPLVGVSGWQDPTEWGVGRRE